KGKGFKLKDFDPGDTCGLTMGKGEAAELLQRGTEWLAEEQDMLYAQNRWSLLLVFQAMDAAGKDGTIKHGMSGVNPQGCQVFSFKQPSSEDLDHDFFWRASKRAPWYVVPADNKWFTRLLVAAAIVEAVENLDLAYPAVDAKKQKELQAMRAALSRGK